MVIDASSWARTLTPRSSGRAHHEVPSQNLGVRAAQLNRYAVSSCFVLAP
jgi:hypothetical protein